MRTTLSNRHVAWTLGSVALVCALAPPSPARANAAREEVTRTLDRTIAVTGMQALTLTHTASGHMTIRTHARSEVRLVARVRVSAESRAMAAEFMDTIGFVVDESSSEIIVATKHAEVSRRYRSVGFAVDLDAEIPERMRISASQRFGALTASGLGGDALLKNTNGRLALTDARGVFILENRFGPIDVARVGGRVTIHSNNGAVTGEEIDGTVNVTNNFGAVSLRNVSQQVAVANSNGAITVQDLRGGAVLTTRFGPVDAQAVRGGLRVDNGNGNILATEIDGETFLKTNFGAIVAGGIRGPVTATNSNGNTRIVGVTGSLNAGSTFGTITLREVDGPIDVRSSNGGLDVGLAPRSAACHNVAMDTRFGAITVYVPGGGYNVNASTRFGRVQTDVEMTVTGTIQSRGSDSSVTGRLGGGGCPMQLTNNNGNITIRKGSGPAVDLGLPANRTPGTRAPRASR